MARKSLMVKQRKRERLVELKKEKRKALKEIIYDMAKSDEERMSAVRALNKMPKDSSRVRLRNRCRLTGRARAYLRKFQVSRLCFREMSLKGLIPGIVKASW